jgi:murein L,D-transpeptidase YafK
MHLFMGLLSLWLVFSPLEVEAQSFLQKQKRFRRVRTAIKDKSETLKIRFRAAKAVYPPKKILIRVFKQEAVLQLWAADSSNLMQKVFDYPICDASGKLGPKRKEGDYQVPEGAYYIDRFNPNSHFFLSLGINYPNRADRKFSDKRRPGGDIFLHGDCVSIGCVAITDPMVKELYLAAVHARNNGQNKIPVHIFPMQMGRNELAKLKSLAGDDVKRWTFWKNLSKVYQAFEATKRIPDVRVTRSGSYLIRGPRH